MMPAEIATQRLELRSIVPDDTRQIARLMSFEVAQYLTRVPWPYDLADAREFVNRLQGTPGQYAVTHNGQFTGVIGGSTMLGYWYGQEFWGQGIATEAGRAFVARWFQATKADALRSGYAPDNSASAHVLAKLGFLPDGFKTTFLNIDRKPVRLQLCVLTRDKWAARSVF